VDVGSPPLEGFRVKYFRYLIGCVLLLSCSSSPLKYEKAKELEVNTEFEKAVKIEEAPLPPEGTSVPAATPKSQKQVPVAEPKATPSESEKTLIPEKKVEERLPEKTPEGIKSADKKTKSKKTTEKSAKKSKKEKKVEESLISSRRQPEFEDDMGFQGRRPIKDPFRIGEVITHDVSYFKISAGSLKLKVEPMVSVNGRRAYNLVTEITTNSMYSSIYSVDDRVETFVDYETLVPSVYSLHVKESGQLREARMLFDDKSNRATFWEKKVTKKSGAEEKKQAWDILPYSQNVFSAIFYMRNFQWVPGKEVAFRVADDEQNLIFKGKCLRRERIDTEIGEKDAVVIKPEITLKGAFKPVGDIYIWLSDDEYHYPLRIESKIKIGTLVSEITSLIPGHN
jgi:hypothetical protein